MDYKMANKADKFLARLIGNYIKLLNTVQKVSLDSAILSFRTTLILVDNNDLTSIGSHILELASETDFEAAVEAAEAAHDDACTFDSHKGKEFMRLLMLSHECEMIIGEHHDEIENNE